MSQASEGVLSAIDEQQAITDEPLVSTSGRDFWRRFRRNRLAVGGTIVFGLIVLLTFGAPLIAPGMDYQQDNTILSKFFFQTDITPTFADFPYRIFGLTSIEDFHRSVLAEVLYGGRPMLILGVGGALLSMIIGTVIGATAGYFGGWVDDVLNWFINLISSMPYLLVVIALIVASQLNNGGVMALLILFGISGWPIIARQVRVNMLLQREQTYTEAAQATGVGSLRIILRHLLPNATGPILSQTVVNAANFMLAEAALSFLGIDTEIIKQVTWGSIIGISYYYGLLSGYWWWWFYPGLFLTLTIVALMQISEGLRDAFDVRSRLI